MFKLLYPFHQRVSIGLQLLRTHFHAFLFHIMKHSCQRHLYFLKKLLHPGFPEFFPQPGLRHENRIYSEACIFPEGLLPLLGRLHQRKLFQKLLPALNYQAQLFICNILYAVIIFQRVEQICRNQHIKKPLRLIVFQIPILVLDLEGG